MKYFELSLRQQDRLFLLLYSLGFGGNLRLMVVASAPLAANVLTFMRCALGCLVVEGYGQTECTGAITLTVQGDHVPNHVGPPVSCNAVKVTHEHRQSFILIAFK